MKIFELKKHILSSQSCGKLDTLIDIYPKWNFYDNHLSEGIILLNNDPNNWL